jgi:hypothetical protein
MFSFCSYHGSRHERKRGVVFHVSPQRQTAIIHTPPPHIPLIALKIFEPVCRRLK